jgi:hypothetical protein
MVPDMGSNTWRHPTVRTVLIRYLDVSRSDHRLGNPVLLLVASFVAEISPLWVINQDLREFGIKKR